MLSLVENLFVKKNPLQDLLSSLNPVISINERSWILTDHVTFKLPYNQIYQMKNPINAAVKMNSAERYQNSEAI